METRLHCPDSKHLPEIARGLIEAFPAQRVFALSGEMGAGKTTFIQALLSQLGSPDLVSSPTFALVNEYRYPEGKVYHFDLYRLRDEAELLDIGFTEYIDSGEYCFIEWPDLAHPHIGSAYVMVGIERGKEDTERYFSWELSE
jgi:tRNA threonylcarbamoyladenosine biosynthesis protein TsaE